MYPLVDDLIKGRLNEQEVDQVWTEILNNPELFAYYRTQIGLTVELSKSGYKRQVKKSISKWWYAVAAAALLVISVGLYLFSASAQNEKEFQAFIAFNAYDLESFDAYRSNKSDDSTFNSKITQATTSLLLGEIENAINMYSTLIENSIFENEVNALLYFNRSLVYFAKKDYEMSFSDLKKALSLTKDETLKNKIVYQKLKVLVAQEKFKEARSYAIKCLQSNLTLTKSQRAYIKSIAE